MTDATTERVPTGTAPGDLELELWVRTACAWSYGRRDSLVQAVQDLAADGVVADATVEVWDGRIALDPRDATDDREARACRRIEAFRDWGRREGVELPALEGGTVIGEGRLGPPVAVRTTPLAMLAAYDGDRLAWVAPHGTGEDHVTVPGCIEALEAAAESTETDDVGPRPDAPPTPAGV